MSATSVLLSSIDCKRLDLLLRDSARGSRVPRERWGALRAKLQQGLILEPSQIPQDVITMNSTVSLRDLDTQELET